MTTQIVPMKYPRGRRSPDPVRLNDMLVELLRHLARDRQHVEASSLAVIEAARAAGMSWDVIADILGVKAATLRLAHERGAERP